MGSACHYCGEQQPRRKLRPLELSTVGDVLVCSEIEACHKRARAHLYARQSAAAPASRGHGRRRSGRRWGIWLTLIVVGVLVLPHFAISGHHWRFWLLP